MKVMISQPMNDISEQEILKKREEIIKLLTGRGYEVLNTYLDDSEKDIKEKGFTNLPLYYLAKSLEYMSKCDTVYFCKGWENKRGCRIEHEAAKSYGLDIIYE